MKKKLFQEQFIPVGLTVVIFVVLAAILYLQLVFLNTLTKQDIILQLRLQDILVGLTIYLKTSVDFAIFIGNLMGAYPGWKGRIAIETGTAVGNAVGTLIILTIWNFFREIEWLLALMIFIASLVLLRLAEDGLVHAKEELHLYRSWFRRTIVVMDKFLIKINDVNERFLKYLIPHATMKPKHGLAFMGLLAASFTIPFILGLDDFAGYVPIFSIINVFGFAVGVFAGHMILNMALFLSPGKTIKAVKQPLISFLGSVVFIGLAVWGFFEAYRILFSH